MAEWNKRLTPEQVAELRAELQEFFRAAPFGAKQKLSNLSGVKSGNLWTIRVGKGGATLPTAQRLRDAMRRIREEPPAAANAQPQPGSSQRLDLRVRAAARKHGLAYAEIASRAGLSKQTLQTFLYRRNGHCTSTTREALERVLAELGEGPAAAIVPHAQQPLPFPNGAGGPRTTTVDVVAAARFAMQHPEAPADPAALVRGFFQDPAFQSLGMRAIEVLMQLAKTTNRQGD